MALSPNRRNALAQALREGRIGREELISALMQGNEEHLMQTAVPPSLKTSVGSSQGHSRKKPVAWKVAAPVTSCGSVQRRERGELASWKKEMGECTFNPRLEETLHVPPPKGDFYQRNIQWIRRKQRKAAIKKAEMMDEEDRECTFEPMVCNKSVALARQQRETADDIVDVDTLLPEEQAALMLERKGPIHGVLMEETLMRDWNATPKSVAWKRKGRLSQRGLRSAARLHEDAQQKQTRAKQQQKDVERQQSISERKECTFTPAIHENPPIETSKALEDWIHTQAHERLTQTTGPHRKHPQAQHLPPQRKASHFASMGSKRWKLGGLGQKLSISVDTSSHGQRQQRPGTAPPGSSRRKPDGLEIWEAHEAMREAVALRRASTRARILAKNYQHRLQEKNRIRKEAVPKVGRGPKSKENKLFLERMEEDAVRRQTTKEQMQQPQYTFTPFIDPKARLQRARSGGELMRDAIRKEKLHAQLRQDMLNEEERECYHQPIINCDRGESVLASLVEDPEFATITREPNLLRAALAKKRKEERKEKYLQQCTFSPEVHVSPAASRMIHRSLVAATSEQESRCQRRGCIDKERAERPVFLAGRSCVDQ